MTILKAILDAIIAVLRFIMEAILAILRAILWLLKKFSSTFSVKASAASLIFSLTARSNLGNPPRYPLAAEKILIDFLCEGIGGIIDFLFNR